MTHAPEIGAENRLHFSGANFWYVCHANLGPDLSGTRNRRRLEHSSISKPESGMRVTEIKGKRYCIAVNGSIPWHSYGVLLAIWDHTVLPATRHK